jgi:outer membrane murein-binding lipoprotein Lpp
MKRHSIPTTVAGLLVAGALSMPAGAQGSGEMAELKAQLQALQSKIEALEKQQQAQQESQDRATDAIAQARSNIGDWVGRFQWKGDLRYRNENIDQEFASSERNRDRIRLRAGFFARVNETLRVEVMAATTENDDARSSNQTLTNFNSRKTLDLDVAYAEWQPAESWKATFGKMRYPWVTTPSGFYDKDINPEGLAVGWQQGSTGLFANAWYVQLGERSAAADSNMAGAQLGWRGDVGEGMRLTVAGGYFDHNAVQGYDAWQGGNVAGNPFSAFGNSTTSTCRPGVPAIGTTPTQTCIANDFNIIGVSSELAMSAGGRPLSFFVDYGQNTEADFSSATIPSELDTAYAAGVQYGRVSGAHTWELGYMYQQTEKDALFGQWIDSDFAAGNTDGNGHAFRIGYGFSRNFRLNGTYFLNKTNIDVPTNISGIGPVTEREYDRVQLDINMSF